jgi:hypothetical protein
MMILCQLNPFKQAEAALPFLSNEINIIKLAQYPWVNRGSYCYQVGNLIAASGIPAFGVSEPEK